MKTWSPFEVLMLSLGMLLVTQCIHIRPGAYMVLAMTTSVALSTRSVRLSKWLLMLASSAGFLTTSLIVAPLSYRSGHGIWHSLYIDPVLLRRATDATLRSLASISCTLLLLCSRSPVEWAAEVPKGNAWRFVADLLVLMERYFYILRDSAKAILSAQEARLSHVSRKREAFSFALMCATLLSRAEYRARRLQDALDARLYTGELSVRRRHSDFNSLRTACIAAMLVFAFAAGRVL